MSAILGTAVGYGVTSLFSGEKTGDRGVLHPEFKIGKHIIHVHHWLVLLCILTIYIWTTDTHDRFFMFVLFGGIAQGMLMYDDWCTFIKKNNAL